MRSQCDPKRIPTRAAQREKLAQIPIKDPERAAHYAAAAAGDADAPAAPPAAPTLADLLDTVAMDGTKSFEEFPLPVRPVHDFLSELQARHVTAT